jgi:hypothetical protein
VVGGFSERVAWHYVYGMKAAVKHPNFFPYNTPTFLKTISFYTHLPAYEYGKECSETSAYKIQTPGKPTLFP